LILLLIAPFKNIMIFNYEKRLLRYSFLLITLEGNSSSFYNFKFLKRKLGHLIHILGERYYVIEKTIPVIRDIIVSMLN